MASPQSHPLQVDFPLIAVIRDERDILPAFFQHYRAMGVTSFHVVDTGSTDGTLEFLSEQADVRTYRKQGGYAQSNAGLEWVNEIGAKHCQGKWTITVDTDEFLQLPPSSKARKLSEFTVQLRKELAFGLYAPLIDHFADDLCGPIRIVERLDDLLGQTPNISSPTSFEGQHVAAFPFYELRSSTRAKISGRQHYKVRCHKIPLVFWREGFRYTRSTHICSPIPLSDQCGRLLHFKYRAGFKKRLEKELQKPDRLNADVYAISRAVIANQKAIRKHTNRTEQNGGEPALGTSQPFDISDAWQQANRSKEYIFDILAKQKLPENGAMEEALARLVRSKSWRLTKPVRCALYRSGFLRHDHYPERLDSQNVGPEDVLAVYDSFWWLLTGIIRLPSSLKRAALWHKLGMRARRRGAEATK